MQSPQRFLSQKFRHVRTRRSINRAIAQAGSRTMREELMMVAQRYDLDRP